MADYSRKVDMAQLREITRKVLGYRVDPELEKAPKPKHRACKAVPAKEKERKSS